MAASAGQGDGKVGSGVHVTLAGRVSITSNGAEVEDDRFPGRQGRLVFAYLAAQHGRPVPRDELADLLWGDEPPATWEKALSVLVSKLRGVLEACGLDGTTVLSSAFGCYRLELPQGSSIDVLDATRAAEDGEASRAEIAQAAAIAARPFLPGDDGVWIEARRRELSEIRVRALERLADDCLSSEEHDAAAKWAQQIIELEPFRESGYRHLMQAHAAAGNHAEALRVYERCRRFLADELGAYPSPETDALYRRLLAERPPAPDYVAEPPVEAVAPEPPRAGAPRRARMLLAGVVLLVAAAAAGAAVVVSRGGTERTMLAPDSVGVIDAKSHRIVAQTPIPGGPARLVSEGRFVWVAGDEAGTLSQVDPRARSVKRLVATGGFPSDLAGGDGAVWVVDGKSGLLRKVDSDYGTVVGRVRVAAPNALYNRSREDLDPTAVASGLGSIWVTDGSRRLTRVNPRSLKIVDNIDLGSSLDGVAVGAGGVWAISGPSATATRLNRRGRGDRADRDRFGPPLPIPVSARGRHGRGVRVGAQRQHGDGHQDRPRPAHRGRHDPDWNRSWPGLSGGR